MKPSRRALSKGAALAILDFVIVIALIGWIVASKAPIGGPAGTPHVTVTDAGTVGANLIRMTVENDGEVRVKILKVTVTDSGIEGSGSPGVVLTPGQSKQIDVGLTKGSISTGETVTLTITIRTDKGEFTQKISVTG